MKNKQNITVCCFLHPVRDVSLGRRNGIQQGTLHPIRDASLTGCRRDSSFAFSTERCIPNGIQFSKSKPLHVICFSFLKMIKMIKMNDLTTKLGTIVVACLLMTTVQAQSLQGKWSVEKVTIEKNTDGKVETTVYDSASEVKSYIPCMKELVVNAQSITLRYPSGWEETAKYTLDGNQLKIMAVAAMQSYQYSINAVSLTLTATYNYVNNLPTGQTKRIEEKWVINFSK